MKQFNTFIEEWKEWLSFFGKHFGYNMKLKLAPVRSAYAFRTKMLIAFILGSFVSFGAPAHEDARLSISTISNSDLTVEIDGRTYELSNHTVMISRITPGYHQVRVMADKKRRFGLFGNRKEVLYSNRVFIREGYHVDIIFNRFGKALIDEQRMDRNYQDNDWWNDEDGYDRRNDHRWDNNDRWDNNNRAMSNADFEQVKNVIRRERTDDSKLSMARNIFSRNYISSGQVRDVCRLFSFDSYKLDFAKFAYDRTTDKHNYHLVYDVFTYKTNRDELADYINKHH